MRIATLLTCHNRKNKTIPCINSLFAALSAYNDSNDDQISMTVYLTDDGCTDGTRQLLETNPNIDKIKIQNGNGSLFWAGGMRMAWRAALADYKEWDFFLLLNDDVLLDLSFLSELLITHSYSIEKTGKAGLYSGITFSTTIPRKLTYSGCVWENRFSGTMKMLGECSEPQQCDVTNANILLVDRSVYDSIGIFYEGFIHGGADHDYSHQAKMHGFPVWVTANCCGYCDNDHANSETLKEQILSMDFSARKKYFDNPVHSIHDYILGTKRRAPSRWVFVAIGRYMCLYCPKVYYWLSDIRTMCKI